MKYAVGLIATLAAVAAFFFGSQGCRKEATYVEQWYARQSVKELVTEYHNQLFPKSTPAPNSRRSLYIDFSSGIGKLLKASKANQEYLTLVLSTTSGSQKFDYYELEDKSIDKMVGTDKERSEKAFNWAQYSKTLAPIDSAIKQLLKDGRSGVLVTDWEAYVYTPEKVCRYSEILDDPYASEEFTDWLNNGGSIEFRYVDRASEKNFSDCRDYEGESEKHIYFTFFIAPGDHDMVNLLSAIDSRWEQKNSTASKFELSQGMEAGYRQNGGGMVEYLRNLEFVREEINESAEIISRPTGKGLDAAGVQQYLVDNIMKFQSNPNDNGYLNKGIVFDSEQNELFKVTGLAVRVYDATSDFEAFLTERMLSSHAEVVEKIIVRNPNSKADEWDSTRVSPLIRNCFQEHTANMKNEFAYAPKAPKEVKQLFKLADGSVEQLTNDPKNVELNLKFDTTPDASPLVCENHGKLLRVEYFVPSEGFEDVREDDLDDFLWQSVTTEGEKNHSLKNSIIASSVNCGPNDVPNSYILYTQYFALNKEGFARNITDVVFPSTSSN